MKGVSQKLLNEVTRRLTEEFQPEEVWLFGSHACGQPDEHSDLDLLVVIPQSAETPVRRAQRRIAVYAGLTWPWIFWSRPVPNWSDFVTFALPSSR